MKKIKLQDNISLYQLKELIKLIVKKLNIEFKDKEIPDNIKDNFK